MKMLICLLLTVVLATGGAFAEAPGNALGFEVLRTLLQDGAENQVVSPISLTLALAMAAEGAEGETQTQILDALGVENVAEITALIAPLEEPGLKIANAAFAKGELQPLENYVASLREEHGAEWFEMQGVDEINAWVSENTDGLIEKLFDSLPEAELALLNAAAMDAMWYSTFNRDFTEDGTFRTPDGEVTVPMMHQTLQAYYGEQDGVQYVRLGYRDSSLAMYVVLPTVLYGVTGVLNSLCEQGMDFFQFDEEIKQVVLSMPKVDISADNRLNDALIALGMEKPFSAEADFSGISEEMQLHIDTVLQKAKLTIDEDGTRAAAVTAVMLAAGAMMQPEKIEFTVDRPFVVLVADEESGAVAFAGVVADPTES